jgi:hypothetical protein
MNMSELPEQKLHIVYEPNDRQKKSLGVMLFHALLEIRVLGWEGKSQQAADLADAFHNLPILMYSSKFDWTFFRYFLQAYQTKYAGSNVRLYDYVAELIEGQKL